ncbi:hypothetical protein SAMN05444166_8269 [Singulisphaera sp. GP187]|uniref:hypothetical protein n=1 Tax=Singulisphaera sp. GP187 TaxID=1882752 RepID=UPI00092AC289|nr:hypothetical protein [Singulisphaera sp. GP187]SIO66911.1 hypothetical protein SAMN05444166_8269 [Singulisphaera sp. GP187]
MSHEQHNAVDLELNAIEHALGSLTPSRSRLDRDQLMFRAGQAATARPASAGRRLWIAVAAGTGLIALGEAALLAHRPAPQIIEKVIVVRDREPVVRDAPTDPVVTQAPAAIRGFGAAPSFGSTAYERLTSQVFRYGLDGLPTPPSTRANLDAHKPSPPLTRQLWQEELLKTLEPGAPS